MQRKVYFDLETTGFGNGVEPVQIGAVYQQQEFKQYIVPTCTIDRRASRIHNLYKRDNRLVNGDGETINEAVSLQEGLQRFVDWLSSIAGRHGCVLVAHNARNFDSIVLEKNLWRRGIEIPFDLFYADSMDIMRKIQQNDGRRNLPNIKLDTSLQYLCGFGQDEIHDALDDARNLKALCAAAAKDLGFHSYVNYLHQHNNEIFQ